MKRSINKQLLLLSLISFLLISCQGEKTPVEKNQAINARADMGGTDSTGGGNGVEGKPLESYIEKNLAETRPYREYVQPLIARLINEYPQLAADFYHITRQRQWYIIPAELKEISNNMIGSFAKTDQYALQDLNKVWINKNLYDAMSERDQATLLIHEIVMGIRLMKFKSKQDYCIAKAAYHIFGDGGEVAYSKSRKDCRKSHKFNYNEENSKFELSSQDYDTIRLLVSLLDHQKPDIEEIKSIIEDRDFRNYK